MHRCRQRPCPFHRSPLLTVGYNTLPRIALLAPLLAAREAIALSSCKEREDEMMNCFNALCLFLLLMWEVLELQEMVIF